MSGGALHRVGLPAQGAPQPTSRTGGPGYPGSGWGVPAEPLENGFWTGTERRIVFGPPSAVFGPVANVVARGVWYSPIFDLKPWLGNSFGTGNDQTVPIRIAGAKLRLQVRGLATAHARTEVWTFEDGHIINPLDMNNGAAARPFQFSSRENISADFYDSAQDVSILLWDMPDAVRFWRVNVVFDQIAAGVTPAFLQLGGLY